jgi:hypothetical protein
MYRQSVKLRKSQPTGRPDGSGCHLWRFDDPVQSGDEAVTELVLPDEHAVWVAVRVRLTDPRLRRRSVLASFFVWAAAGQFELKNPHQLGGLLVKMTRNNTSQDRSARPPDGSCFRSFLIVSTLGSGNRSRGARGSVCAGIARELGGTPQGSRLRLLRAIDRLATDLGLADGLAGEV